MVCSKCGNSDAKGVTCDKCGTPLISRLDDDSSAEATTPETVPTTEAVVVPTTQPIAQPETQPVAQSEVQSITQPVTEAIQQIPVSLPTEQATSPATIPVPVEAQVPQVPVQIPVDQISAPQQVQASPTQILPTMPADPNVGAQVSVDSNQMTTAQVVDNPLENSGTNTGAAEIEAESAPVMDELNIPSDFKLSDDPNDNDEDILNNKPVEEKIQKKSRVPLKSKKKSLKKMVRKTKNMFGKLIVTVLLIIGFVYFWIYYVEPSGFLVDILNR